MQGHPGTLDFVNFSGYSTTGTALIVSKGTTEGQQQLVQSLRQLCRQHLSDAFKKFNEICASSLVEMAARAESNRLQTLYLDSQRILRKQRSTIEAKTLAAVLDHFAALERGEFAAKPDAGEAEKDSSNQAGNGTADPDHLKLLGDEDLEVMIALDNCSSRVHEEWRGPLHQLEGRLKSLLDTSLPLKQLPISADLVLEAFITAIDKQMIALEVQLELVRIFDLACFDKSYGDLLSVANSLLEQAGYSAAPDRVVNNNPGESAEQKSLAADGRSSAIAERDADYSISLSADGNSRVQTELLAKISSMLESAETCAAEASATAARPSLASQAGTSDTTSANANTAQVRVEQQSLPCMDKPQLIAEINRHISDLIANRTELLSNGQITRELSTALKEMAEREKGSRLHRNDQSLFQVVEETFSSFGNSMELAPEVQQLINRCELPMLKLAIQKPLILEQENHPIRRLFNEMAKYAIGLEQGDCEDNRIYQQMLKLSESMLGESFDEHKLPAMLSEFMAIVDRDRRAISAAEERELEQVAAREKVNWARTRVEEEIARRIMGKKLSQAVVDFIQHSWCMVMHLAHLRGGEAGGDWLAAIKLLETLVYLVRRSPTAEDIDYRHELLAHLDARLEHISMEMVQRALQLKQLAQALGIPQPPTLQSAVVTEIKPTLAKRQRRKAKQTAVPVAEEIAEQQVVDDIKEILVSAVKAQLPGRNISREVRDAETLDSSAQRLLMALQKGCWIELGDDIKAHKRGKLAGIVGPSWKYVFVDNKGKLIAERDRARLALELMDGKVTVLDNSHLFDKAIKQAITRIKGLPVAS